MWNNTTTPISFIVSLLKKIISMVFSRFLPFTLSRDEKFYTQGFGVRVYENRNNKLECNECEEAYRADEIDVNWGIVLGPESIRDDV